ncbi:MAG: carboxypeptidase regulatory-like domain-containing protein [Planctomycetes bacterium]|nr:carboxypeptidase regulatory-like domain-containing protein [Planctomycetota bacterium]
MPKLRNRVFVAIASVLVLALLVWWLRGNGDRKAEDPGVPSSTVETTPSTPLQTVSTDSNDAGRITPPSSEEDAAPSAMVEGRVRDALGTPLAGVQIETRRPSGARGDADAHASRDRNPPLGDFVTDETGRFAISWERDARASLTFSLPGYRPRDLPVRSPSSGHDVVLERSPKLLGRVVRTDDSPVADALVRWSNPFLAPGAGATISTSADGRFEFDAVPWTVYVEVLAPDALPAFRTVRVNWGMPEVVIVVDDGRIVTGKVVDAETDHGVENATIELWYYRSSYDRDGKRSPPSLCAETTSTEADGRFRLERLPSVADKKRPETYLWVRAPAYAPHWQIVRFPERVDALKVALYRAGSLRGRVVDESGTPLAGRRVWAEAKAQPLCEDGPDLDLQRHDTGHGSAMWSLRRPEDVAPWQVERDIITDSAGAYRMDGIPCPSSGGDVTVTLGLGRPSATVITKPDDTVVVPDLVWPSDAFRHWHGIVQDPMRRPVACATIDIGTGRTISDAEGRFELALDSNIQGAMSLEAHAPGFATHRIQLQPTKREARRPHYCECPVDGLTITLAPAVDLAVSVVDRGQRPVPNASVQAFEAGALHDFENGASRPPALGRGITDDRGAVRLIGVPKSCGILVEHPRSGSKEHRKILATIDASSGTLRVVLDTLDITAVRASLTVRVDDILTGMGIESLVRVEIASGDQTKRALSPGPEVRLDDLPLGTWDVTVSAEGFGCRSTGVHLSESRRIEVHLGEGAELLGIVTCTEDRLSEPVQVLAKDIARERLTIARSDSSGRFTFRGLAPGQYQVLVEPFEHAAFDRWGRRLQPQRKASLAPVEVTIGMRSPPLTIQLPIVRFELLRVTVAPAASTLESQSLWSWAQGLRFVVRDTQKRIVYQGGASTLAREHAQLVRNLPAGTHTVTVMNRGRIVAERTILSGGSVHVDER